MQEGTDWKELEEQNSLRLIRQASRERIPEGLPWDYIHREH